MATSFPLPETVTVPAGALFEALAMLDTFATALPDIVGGEADPFFNLEAAGYDPLLAALVEALDEELRPSEGNLDGPLHDALTARESQLRGELAGLTGLDFARRLTKAEERINHLELYASQ